MPAPRSVLEFGRVQLRGVAPRIVSRFYSMYEDAAKRGELGHAYPPHFSAKVVPSVSMPYFIESGGKIIGGVVMSRADYAGELPVAHLETMLLAAQHRKKLVPLTMDVGMALLLEAQRLGYHTAEVRLESQNTRGAAMYEAMGWKKHRDVVIRFTPSMLRTLSPAMQKTLIARCRGGRFTGVDYRLDLKPSLWRMLPRGVWYVFRKALGLV